MQCLNRCIILPSTVFLARRLLTCRHSSTKLFVGGLSYDTNETVLKDAFGKYGDMVEVKVICDRVYGESKGYGFVQFTSQTAASTALKEMDGQKHSCTICEQGIMMWSLGPRESP